MTVRRAGTATVATRRPVFPRPLAALIAVALAVLAYLGAVAAGQVESPGVIAEQAAAPAPGASALLLADGPRRDAPPTSDRSGRDVGTAAFAEVDGLEIHLVSDDVVTVAFHEATQPEALPLTPVGTLIANENATKFVPPQDADGPDYHVLSSRGRGRPATSAVDVVLVDGSTAAAPVTGEVVEVRQYSLYGEMKDWRVVIRPDDRPDLHVVMIHLHQPQVDVGDRVTAGSSPIAVARLLPFTSHVDSIVEGRNPHVHIEVKAAIAPAPLDPNAPAVMPEDHVEQVG